jgi:hypothetical protein
VAAVVSQHGDAVATRASVGMCLVVVKPYMAGHDEERGTGARTKP